MTSRGHPGPSRIIRHAQEFGSGSGVIHLVDASLPPELAEKKLVAEVERLANENHRLATAQILLRRDLVCAQDEVQTVKAHIRSIQTEGDIQIRVLMEKIAKMEAECKNAANIKKELEHTRKELQRLVVARQELADKVEQANKELSATQMEIKQLPDVLSVLDSMKEEHHRLRISFEYDKEINIRTVEQLKAMEREFIGMGREVERLQTEILNAEKSLQTPSVTATYSVPYQNPAPSHPAQAIQSNGFYYHPYGVPSAHMAAFPVGGMIPPTQTTPPVEVMVPTPQTIPPVHGMIPPPPTHPPIDEAIPPPPATPFDETIPLPPPNDPPPSVG